MNWASENWFPERVNFFLPDEDDDREVPFQDEIESAYRQAVSWILIQEFRLYVIEQPKAPMEMLQCFRRLCIQLENDSTLSLPCCYPDAANPNGWLVRNMTRPQWLGSRYPAIVQSFFPEDRFPQTGWGNYMKHHPDHQGLREEPKKLVKKPPVSADFLMDRKSKFEFLKRKK